MTGQAGTQRIHGYCSLCIARCGTVATVVDGRFTRLDPDPSHPTGQAICAKGRAAPELVYHKDRLTRPLRRTRPKGDADPGWVEISWDEALDATAAAMRRIADRHGPQAVAFSQSSPSTTAIADSAVFVRRLMNAFGTPNMVWALDLCGWGRGFATRYAFGVGSVGTGSAGGGMADIENSGCLILWGYNPSISRLTHATATVAALKRGMKLIVIDPRRAGLANKADIWLRVRPGTDGALALGLANVMIQRGWYDRDFIRDWSNGPHLVRADTGALLREHDLSPSGDPKRLVAWDTSAARPVAYDPATGRYDGPGEHLALDGEYRLTTPTGTLTCRPVFDHYAALCRQYSPEMVAATCWIPAAQLEETARLIWHARPVSYYAWSGHEHHANTTETARAMALLYALTGSFDAAGGNVLFPAVPSAPITGEDLPAAKHLAPAIGLADRPLGPARWNNVSAQDFYARGAGRHALPHARSDRVRVQYAAGLLRPGAGPAGARGAGLPCPCRSVHEPHRPAGRYRAAGRIILRARGAEDRLRDQPGGAIPRAAPPGRGAAARAGAARHRHHLRSRHAARPGGPILGRRYRGRLSPPAGAERREPGTAARPAGRHARGRCTRATPSTRRRMRTAIRAASRPRPARSSSGPRRFARPVMPRCPASSSRQSVPRLGPTWRRATRWC